MFSGLNIFFRLRRDPANNDKLIVELFLSWIFFSGKLGPGISFRKIFLPPHKNQMVAP